MTPKLETDPNILEGQLWDALPKNKRTKTALVRKIVRDLALKTSEQNKLINKITEESAVKQDGGEVADK